MSDANGKDSDAEEDNESHAEPNCWFDPKGDAGSAGGGAGL